MNSMPNECRRAMQAYCREVVLIPNPYGGRRPRQAAAAAPIPSLDPQLRTPASYVPALQQALDQVLRASGSILSTWSSRTSATATCVRLRPGERPPKVVVDSHEIAYDLARQFARAEGASARRLYAGVNWRKLRREELKAYRDADGVCLCSVADRAAVARRGANGPHRGHSQRGGRRVLPAAPRPILRRMAARWSTSDSSRPFPISTASSISFEDIWPRIASAHPDARFKIIGGRPPLSLRRWPVHGSS